jgi:hypothetical protein
MRTVEDFEDLLLLFEQHNVRYLIVGGLAFIFHAKPRYTKDMDIWVENDPDNIHRANDALSVFGSPCLLSLEDQEQVLQIGVEPNRVNLLVSLEGVLFSEAWSRRIQGEYGGVAANWIDIESLHTIKSLIQHPRHQEDARVLAEVMRVRNINGKK